MRPTWTKWEIITSFMVNTGEKMRQVEYDNGFYILPFVRPPNHLWLNMPKNHAKDGVPKTLKIASYMAPVTTLMTRSSVSWVYQGKCPLFSAYYKTPSLKKPKMTHVTIKYHYLPRIPKYYGWAGTTSERYGWCSKWDIAFAIATIHKTDF